MLTGRGDPKVMEALTRKCSACEAPKGSACLCTIHRPQHTLALCPTATGRIVHHARIQPPPRGGQ